MEVGSARAHRRVVKEMEDLTAKTQQDEKVETERKLFLFKREFVTNRYCMLVIRLVDDRGNKLSDYEVLFTAGPNYDPNHLPPGFFVDRQRNQLNPGKLPYYIDYDVMREWLDKPELGGKFGVQIKARPAQGFAYYTVAEHRGTFAALRQSFEPNRTVMVEVELRRHVVEGVFRLTQDLTPEDFKKPLKGADLTGA
jgi:hypothetical protein